MAKMTKAQAKRMLQAIESKTKKVWSSQTVQQYASGNNYITTADMLAIEKICKRNLKRLG